MIRIRMRRILAVQGGIGGVDFHLPGGLTAYLLAWARRYAFTCLDSTAEDIQLVAIPKGKSQMILPALLEDI